MKVDLSTFYHIRKSRKYAKIAVYSQATRKSY